MLLDGLTDVYNHPHGELRGIIAKEKGISREDQDAFAIESYNRATGAWDAGKFANRWFPSLCLRGEEMTSWWIAMKSIAM